ncbi:MAG: diguanylate cyclase [Dehalococcoidia bacterium]
MVATTEVALGSLHDVALQAAATSSAAEEAANIEGSLHQLDRMLPPAEGAAAGRPAPAFSAAELVAAARHLTQVTAAAERLHDLLGSETSLRLLGASLEADAFLQRYLEGADREDLDAFLFDVAAMSAIVERVRPQLAGETALAERSLLSIADTTRYALFAAAVVSGVLLTVTTWLLGRRLRKTLIDTRAEQLRLAASTAVAERRNDQLQALYQIVSEVSETLSLKYVVRTAVEQARKLVLADMVALRVLTDGKLVLAGSDQDVEGDVMIGSALELGAGSVGRAAKRGKTARIDDNAEASFHGGEGILGASSGIIVPLIVGARVVGTLECWSRTPGAFSKDDERILELMASQVATAVISADAHEASERAAHHDALTGIPNRRQLARDLEETYAPAVAAGEQVAFAMIDVDHFKRFNDDFGHKVGDVTLQKVAEVMRSALRGKDIVYRYGGEEFIIVLQNVTGDVAIQVLERIRAAVARTPLTGEELQPVGPVTVSIGLAMAPEHGTSPDALIVLADQAMYQSKSAGRDRVTMFNPEMAELAAAA